MLGTITCMDGKILLLTLALVASCSESSKKGSEVGRSRSELLEDIPYRGELINDEISSEIVEAIRHVIERSTTLNEPSIFYKTSHGTLDQLEGKWENGTAAIKQADEFWRTTELEMTVITYPSYSQNAQTGETSELWVVQVDHRSVSRTCRMFFETPTPTVLTELDCLTFSQNSKGQVSATSASQTTVAGQLKDSTEHPITTTEQADGGFEPFLIKFSSNEEFQLLRIEFPLAVKLIDIEDKEETQIIQKSDWQHYNLLDTAGIETRDIDAYSQQIEIQDSAAFIKLRGIDNGIRIDYRFHLKNGQWFLFEVVNVST